jgi:eukaryotic-like serine/threonine-protein kinase
VRPETSRPTRRGSSLLATGGWLLAALLAIVATTTYLVRRPATTLPATPLQFAIPAPEKGAFDFGIAVSPDGKSIVFRAAGNDGRSRLWHRPLASIEARPLAGTEGGAFPFWAPDGKRLGFFADGKLRKIDLSSGEVLTISEAGHGGGGTWNADDVIVFAPTWESPLLKVSASGGRPSAVTSLDSDRQDALHIWPHFLPDGRRFLFSIVAPDQTGLYAGSLDSPDLTLIRRGETVNESSMTVYADGYIFYVQRLALFAQSFDLATLQLQGDPVRISDALDIWGPGTTNLSVSAGEVLAFREEQPFRNVRLTWFDQNGKFLEAVDEPGAFNEFSVSPDGRRAAVGYKRSGTLQQIAIVDLTRGVTTVLTSSNYWHGHPVWSRDGTRILYSVAGDTPPNIFAYDEASGETRRLQRQQVQSYVCDVSPDGQQILLQAAGAGGSDLLTLHIDGGEPVPLLDGPAREDNGRFSPDGRSIIWVSNESGRPEIYLASYPSLRGKVKISSAGGSDPAWGPDGRRIYYRWGDRLMVVQLGPGQPPSVSAPRELFSLPFRHYDVARDGKILVSVLEEQPEISPIRVIVNWKESLPR